MTSPQAPEDGQGSGDPSGDLRSVLVTSVLNLEPLDEDLFRDPNLHEKYRVGLNRIAAQEVPIEIKMVNPPTLNKLQNREPNQMFWVRARGHIGEGDIKMHCCVAAYISDYAFLGTALLPHHYQHKVCFMASLDHSMWFHAPFRADHWMLYECKSPWAGFGSLVFK
ncbi:acyl-CoA thioesterase 8 [Rhinolophus ferrumequinum]|uniref:Acyl-CoA thioesterase 8 n=1 Tax=Rhinolophus ferrumequinum TaxID=59479 RepID=A0A7J7S6J4_RHIFE|nr:acyl-CoA thioesterase 8 [Rhinolophus ferrumequinum]